MQLINTYANSKSVLSLNMCFFILVRIAFFFQIMWEDGK